MSRIHPARLACLLLATSCALTACERPAPAPGANGIRTGENRTTESRAAQDRPDGDVAAETSASPRTQDTALVALHYEIEGMSCSGCVDAITAKVTKVPGVATCAVDLESKHATVEARGAEDDAAIRAAIERMGYKVKVLAGPAAAPSR